MRIKTTIWFKLRRLTYGIKKEGDSLLQKIRRKWIHYLSKASVSMREEEIFESCIVLKNLAAVYKDLPMSEDFIVEQLMDSSRLLKDVYADILEKLRNGAGAESFDTLYERVPVKSAKSFSAILKKLENINPAELLQQMNSFEETFSDERITRGMRKAERGSIITTVSATVTVFAILLNFTSVVVFMDAIAMIHGFI